MKRLHFLTQELCSSEPSFRIGFTETYAFLCCHLVVTLVNSSLETIAVTLRKEKKIFPS